MGTIRQYRDRVVVSLGITDLMGGPVMLWSRQSKRIHVLRHALSEIIINMIWSRLWRAFPELANAKLYDKTTLTFNKETASFEVEWHKFPITEGSHVGHEATVRQPEH
jgi:hypothetical protein